MEIQDVHLKRSITTAQDFYECQEGSSEHDDLFHAAQEQAFEITQPTAAHNGGTAVARWAPSGVVVVSIAMEVPQNGCFIMENPIKMIENMDDLGVPPFMEPPRWWC